VKKLSQHFYDREFACRCGCGYKSIAPELVRLLEEARIYFDSPITVNSGCRCLAWNAKQGSKPSSQHVKGLAADIEVKGISPEQVADYFITDRSLLGGVGRYKSFTHVDVRGKKARWGKN